MIAIESAAIINSLDIDPWPAGFFYLAGQFGPVDLALHWPKGASERKFGPQGCSFCAGPKCKSDRDVAAIGVVFRRLERFLVHFRRMTN